MIVGVVEVIIINIQLRLILLCYYLYFYTVLNVVIILVTMDSVIHWREFFTRAFLVLYEY